MLKLKNMAAHRSRREVYLQLAEAIRLEVADLQNADVEIIQIDKAAFRERSTTT